MEKVLVVISYTDFKWYCRPLFPKIYEDLTYPGKELLFVTEENYPGLSKYASGDIVCARAREFGIKRAKEVDAEWVFFMDIDSIPDVDILEQLLSVNHPFVGGTIAARGDSTAIIGHTYGDIDKLDRIPLNFRGEIGIKEVDGVSGALMLVHKSIFKTVDYSGYNGVYTIPLRTTCDDEFYCIKVRKFKNIKPKINLNARAWHIHTDGFGYRWYGEKKAYTREKEIIKFDKKVFVEG